jgi:hypothetical protein
LPVATPQSLLLASSVTAVHVALKVPQLPSAAESAAELRSTRAEAMLRPEPVSAPGVVGTTTTGVVR